VPVGGEQATALAGAHRAAGEGELQVPHIAVLAVADLLVGAAARTRHQGRRDLGHACQRSAQRERGGQFASSAATGCRAGAQLRNPDRPVGGRPADRAVSLRDDGAGLPAQVIVFVAADEKVLGAADHVQDARAGVGRP
jgi:hypothetical protein